MQEERIFEKARPEDLDEVFALYRSAAADLMEKGIDQWDEIYPSREVLEADIRAGEMTVLRQGGDILAAVVVNEQQDKGYAEVIWQSSGPKTAVVHRLCVKTEHQGHGIAVALMRYIEDETRRLGYNDIRLDAFTDNPFSQKLYLKLGYHIAGEVMFRKGRFLLFEKVHGQTPSLGREPRKSLTNGRM